MIPTESVSTFQKLNQERSLGLRAPQATKLVNKLGVCPNFLPKAPDSHFFINHHNYTHYKALYINMNHKEHIEDSMLSRRQTTRKAELPAPKKQLKLCGANIRSLFSPENLYSFHKSLDQMQPDIFFLVETWHQPDYNKSLTNKRYQALYSPCDDQKGGGVAIIHQSDLIVTPLFPELHTRNLLLARLSSQSTWPVLLLAIYFPPDYARKQEMIAHVIRVLEYIRTRYRSFGLIMFGDLNSDFTNDPESPDCKRMLKMIRACALEIHRDHNPDSVTRSQKGKSSYLDYFLSTGVKIFDTQVGESIGSSDHRTISCSSSNFKPVRRRRQRIFSKKKATDLLEDILGKEEEDNGEDSVLYKRKPIEFFLKLSHYSRSHSIISEPRPMNYFKTIQLVEEELKHPSPNWKRVGRAVSSCKRTEFLALLEEAKSHKLTNELKEFHRIVQNIMKIRKQNTSVHEIEDPQVAGQVIYEPERLKKALSEKYRLLFGSATQHPPFQVGKIQYVTQEELEECLGMISYGKGMGMDCIPDTILQLPVPRLKDKLRQFVNTVFRERNIPAPFNCARLHLLNKLKSGIPGLDDLRPIMITSPLVKLIESIALTELKSKLEPAITVAQTGFISKLGTQVHILRLLGRIIDIRNSPTYKSGNWLTFFIDFKSAFDKVDHQILFRKLQESGISQRTINILKLLYNSYHFSLMDSNPSKINSGVAQGSLVSPLLYDWYVNDLVSHLSEKLGVDHTFAYADDIALLCLGYSDVRAALSAIESWCVKNGALLNKKKCGILPVRKKETNSNRREIEGIPVVLDYKYLGIPLDSALTLKHSFALVKSRVKKFNQRIGLVLQNIVGTATKLSLWQTYARCHFEYFSPAMALCNQLHKFDPVFTGSLKKALGLPTHLPNEGILRATGIPSLTQIAGYHIKRNYETILQRFGRCPSSLVKCSDSLDSPANQYLAYKKVSVIKERSGSYFKVDLRAAIPHINKELLGLMTGVYLTLRCTEPSQGPIGSIRSCAKCKTPATQAHFLNNCPINQEPRRILKEAIPADLVVPLLIENKISTFFEQLREIEIRSLGNEVNEEKLEPLTEALVQASTDFVAKTLSAIP